MIGNSSGPMTLPCGTQDDSLQVSDFSDSTATYCEQCDTNDFTQLSVTPLTLNAFAENGLTNRVKSSTAMGNYTKVVYFCGIMLLSFNADLQIDHVQNNVNFGNLNY